MTRGSEEREEPRPIQIVRDDEEVWRLQDGPEGPDTVTPEQSTDSAQQMLNEPVIVDDEGNLDNAQDETQEQQSQEPNDASSAVVEEVSRKIITAIRDNLGEFAPYSGEETVYVDEEGNVVSAGNLPTTTERPRGHTTAIRDSKGEFSADDETFVRIDEDGEIVGDEERGTAIRDIKGEYASGQDYAFAGPAGLFFVGADHNRPRWRVEYEKVQKYCPQFSFKAQNGVITSVEGDFRIHGQRYGIRIVIPSSYPYNIPKIYPRGWKPSGAPHRYGDDDLCVMRPSDWSRQLSIAWLIKKTAIWINKWLVWKRTKSWPDPAHH